MKRFFVVAATLSLFSFFTNNARAELTVGDKVPAFEMVGSDGKTYTSEQFKKENKIVVIAWYPKAFTGG